METLKSNSITDDFIISSNILVGNLVCSCLSILSCIAVLALYIYKRKIRSLIHSLIICIAVSEIITNVGHLISIRLFSEHKSSFPDSIYCNIQSILTFFGDTTTMIFLGFITYCVYQYIIKQNSILYLKKRIFILVGFILSSIITIIIMIFFFNASNKERDLYMTWCWIKNKDVKHNKVLYIVFAYNAVLIIFIWIIIVYVYCYITQKARELGGENHQRNLNHLAKKLLSYPIIGTVGWVFTLLTSFFPFEIHDSGDSKYTLNSFARFKFQILAIDGMYMSLRGFFISLLFFSGDKVKKEITDILSVLEKLLNKIHQGLVIESQMISDSNSTSESQNLIEESIVNEKLYQEK